MSPDLPFVAEVDGYVVGVAWLLLAERVPGNGSLDRWYGDVQSVMVREKHPKPCTHPTMEIGQLETAAEKPG